MNNILVIIIFIKLFNSCGKSKFREMNALYQKKIFSIFFNQRKLFCKWSFIFDLRFFKTLSCWSSKVGDGSPHLPKVSWKLNVQLRTGTGNPPQALSVGQNDFLSRSSVLPETWPLYCTTMTNPSFNKK